MKTSVLVHGPQGCGKTRHRQQLMKHFGLERCLDDVYFRSVAWLKLEATKRPTLFLTNDSPANLSSGSLRHIRVISYSDAAKEAGLPVTTGVTA